MCDSEDGGEVARAYSFECGECGEVVAGRSPGVARIRGVGHYKEQHPDVYDERGGEAVIDALKQAVKEVVEVHQGDAEYP